MDELVVRTEVYADPEDVYDFLLDFSRYARYSEYLRDVRTLEGDGGPGTRYALAFAWWKVTYTAHSRVTGVEPPEWIDWEITKDIDADGCWRVTPKSGEGRESGESEGEDESEESGEREREREVDSRNLGRPPACKVALEVEFDPGSASSDALDLPRLVSFDWVLRKAIPLIRREAERVVERAVRDLEGSTRDVELDVYVDSERV
ncbi:SRPBCC family protein [Halorubrum trueperi]|uniref:SRPBCC family protein n=1 Tax=Halorubrum trueperi TaxID=2004704 RepID=A0ABD5UJE8_9EURY